MKFTERFEAPSKFREDDIEFDGEGRVKRLGKFSPEDPAKRPVFVGGRAFVFRCEPTPEERRQIREALYEMMTRKQADLPEPTDPLDPDPKGFEFL